jgi:signal peptidase
MKTAKKWLNRLLSTVLFLLLVSVAGIVITSNLTGSQPELFGYQLKYVLSGSMEPEIRTGSLVALKSVDESEKSSFQNGDVIAFIDEEQRLVTHRIVDVMAYENSVAYETKGDNNNAPDRTPVLAENVVGHYTGFTIPYIGYILSFAQSSNGMILTTILVGVVMVGHALFSVWRALRELDQAKAE